MQGIGTFSKGPSIGGILLVISSVLFSACLPEIPAGNPYDPETPVEQQQKAGLVGLISGKTAEGMGPLIGAEITLTGPTIPDNAPLTTTDTGKYSFLGLEPGRYDISISHGSHITRDMSYDLQPGEERLMDIALQPIQEGVVTESTGHLSGSAHKSGELALDQEYQDHSGITVEVEDTGIRTTTNRSGQFDLFLNAGTYNLILSATNYNLTRKNSVEILANQEMALDAPVVLDPNPGTLAGTLLLEGADATSNDNIVVSLENTSLTTLTDADGTFQLTDVPAGTYTMRATKDEYDTLIATGVTVSGGRKTELNSRTVSRSRGALEGQIQLAAEASHSNISIEVGGTSYSAATNAAGYFRLEGVPTGTYDVSACKQGFEPVTSSISVIADSDTSLNTGGQPLTLAQQQITISSDSLLASNTTHTINVAVPSSVTEFRVTGDVDDEFSQDFQSYNGSGSIDVTLSSGDGIKLLAVQFRGEGCYISNEFTVLVNLDTSGPRLIGSEFSEGDLTASTDVTLSIFAFDAAEMKLSGDLSTVAGEASQANEWITASQTIVIGLDGSSDGEKTIIVQARDSVGNPSLPSSLSTTILLDRTAPENGSILIDGGKTVTSIGEVDLTLGADGADYMKISNDPAFTDAPLIPFTNHVPSWPVADSTTDGTKTIYVQFSDKAGNESALLSASISLDTLGSATGFVQLEESDACSSISVTLNGSSQTASWNGCQFTLTDVPIGVYSLTLSQTGFESATILTEIDPTNAIDVGTLTLLRSRGTAIGSVQLQSQSNHAGTLITFQALAGGTAPSYTTTTLDDGSFTREGMWAGSYEVNAEKSNYSPKYLGQIVIAGNETTNITSAGTVTLSQQTGDFLVNGGSGYTKDEYVELSLSFNDIASFRFRVNGGVFSNWITWSDSDADGTMLYGNADEVNLGATNESKTIEIQTRDTSGSDSAQPYYQANIVVDTIKPTDQALSLDGGAEYTNSSTGQVIATLSAADDNGIDLVVLTSSPSCDGVSSQAYSPIITMTLSGADTDEEKTVYACFIDPAGNVSDPISQTINLDRSKPEIQAFGLVQEENSSLCTSGCLVNSSQLVLQLTESFDPLQASTDTRELWITRNDPTFSTGSWQAYAPNAGSASGVVFYDLPNSDDTYTLYLKAKDAAGNIVGETEGDRISLEVILDTTEPDVPAATLSSFINTTSLAVSFSNTTGIATIEASWDPDFAVLMTETPNSTVSFALPTDPNTATSAEGAYNLYLRYLDAAGNRSSALTLSSIYDATPPAILAAQVNYGEVYVASATSVPVEVTCFDTIANANELILLINDSSGTELYNGSYSPLVTVDIPSVDGSDSLAIRCQDPASNITSPQIVPYELDTTNPTGASLKINPTDGISATHTNSTTVALNLSATDSGTGIREMAIADTALDCATASYENFKSSLTWVLPEGDGGKTIAACIQDAAGNVTSVSESIVLDETPPTGNLAFVDGAITQTNKVLLLASSDDSTPTTTIEMAFGEGILDCTSAQLSYQAFSTVAQEIELSGSNSTFPVSLCLRDQAQNTTRYTKTIVVDDTPPEAHFTINGGAIFATDTTVSIAILGASSDVVAIQIGNTTTQENAIDIDCSVGNYVPFSSIKAHSLDNTEGEQAVQICLKDAAGNYASLTSERIILDTMPPQLDAIGSTGHTGIIFEGGHSATKETTLDVDLRASDATSGISQFKLSSNENCTGGSWASWPSNPANFSPPITITSGDEEIRYASVIFRDNAGLESVCSSTSIVVDTVPLAITDYTITGGLTNPAYTTNGTISYEISYLGTGTCGHVYLSESGDFSDQVDLGCSECTGIGETACNTKPNCSWPDPTVAKCSSLNNPTECSAHSDCGWEASPNPHCSQFEKDPCVNDPACNWTDLEVCESAEPAFCTEICTDSTPGSSTIVGDHALASFAQDLEFNQPVSIRVVDDVGNESPTSVLVMQVDSLPPELSDIEILGGPGSDTSDPSNLYTNQTQLTVLLGTKTGSPTEIRYSRDYGTSSTCSSNLSGYQSSGISQAVIVNFPDSASGEKKVCLAILDEAGNASTVRSANITIDQTAPAQPGVSNANILGANNSCANITPAQSTSAIDENFWKWEIRSNGTNWLETYPNGAALPTDSSAIEFELYQDSDNIVEIRAVDAAGNRGDASQAFVEEVSSFFIPTDLQIKQICNGGRYAILKDLSIKTSVYRAYDEPYATVVDVPRHAILNLETLQIMPLSPILTTQTLLGGCSGDQELLEAGVLDATCSPQEGDSAILITASKIASCSYNAVEGAVNYKLDSNLWVYPYPIDAPLVPPFEIGPVISTQNEIGSLSTQDLAITSIDLVDWTSTFSDFDNYDFRAVVVDAAQESDGDMRYNIRRIEAAVTETGTFPSIEYPTTMTVNEPLNYAVATADPDVPDLNWNQYIMQGLNLYSSYGTSFVESNSSFTNWYVKQACTHSSSSVCDLSTSTLDTMQKSNFTDSDGLEYMPYGTRFFRASFNHWSIAANPTQNSVFVDDGGNIQAYRYDSPTESTRIKELGNGGGSDAFPAFFEYGYQKIGWVDNDNPRIVYRSDTYGTINDSAGDEFEQAFRHPINTAKSIFPYPLGTGSPGKGFLLYHTNSLSQGIVVGFKNNTGCAQ